MQVRFSELGRVRKAVIGAAAVLLFYSAGIVLLALLRPSVEAGLTAPAFIGAIVLFPVTIGFGVYSQVRWARALTEPGASADFWRAATSRVPVFIRYTLTALIAVALVMWLQVMATAPASPPERAGDRYVVVAEDGSRSELTDAEYDAYRSDANRQFASWAMLSAAASILILWGLPRREPVT